MVFDTLERKFKSDDCYTTIKKKKNHQLLEEISEDKGTIKERFYGDSKTHSFSIVFPSFILEASEELKTRPNIVPQPVPTLLNHHNHVMAQQQKSDIGCFSSRAMLNLHKCC